MPFAGKPNIAVLAVANCTQRGRREIARENDACLSCQKFTSGDDLERAILRAMAFVGRMPGLLPGPTKAGKVRCTGGSTPKAHYLGGSQVSAVEIRTQLRSEIVFKSFL